MKKKQILSIILVSVVAVSTIGVGYFLKAANKGNREKGSVKTIVASNRVEGNEVTEEGNTEVKEEEKQQVRDKEENLKQEIKSANNTQELKEETKNKGVNNKEISENDKNNNDEIVSTVVENEIKINNDNTKNVIKSNDEESIVKDNYEKENKESLKNEEVPNDLNTKAGFMIDYYEKDGELYIVFDETEFFRNEDAEREYYKDGNVEQPEFEWGHDYYIRNKEQDTKVYKVSKNSKLELLSFEVGKSNTVDLVRVTEKEVKEKIDKFKGKGHSERGLLVYIDESDNVIYGMRSIYTP